MTLDPIGDGMNWYAYAKNSPVMRRDPKGLASWSSICVAACELAASIGMAACEIYPSDKMGCLVAVEISRRACVAACYGLPDCDPSSPPPPPVQAPPPSYGTPVPAPPLPVPPSPCSQKTPPYIRRGTYPGDDSLRCIDRCWPGTGHMCTLCINAAGYWAYISCPSLDIWL